jgi:hypothetical protein
LGHQEAAECDGRRYRCLSVSACSCHYLAASCLLLHLHHHSHPWLLLLPLLLRLLLLRLLLLLLRLLAGALSVVVSVTSANCLGSLTGHCPSAAEQQQQKILSDQEHGFDHTSNLIWHVIWKTCVA